MTALMEANPELAEVLFVVAFAVFVLGALVSIMRRNGWAIETAVLFTGLALCALGWAVL